MAIQSPKEGFMPHNKFHAVYRERDDYGDGPVIEFGSQEPDSPTFLALAEDEWEALGSPGAITITVEQAGA